MASLNGLSKIDKYSLYIDYTLSYKKEGIEENSGLFKFR